MVDQLTSMERIVTTPIPVSCNRLSLGYDDTLISEYRWYSPQAMRDAVSVCIAVHLSKRT